jgi:hypothetical protein
MEKYVTRCCSVVYSAIRHYKISRRYVMICYDMIDKDVI